MTVSNNNNPDEEVFTLRDLLMNYVALARRGLRYWMRGAAIFIAIFAVGMVVVIRRQRVYKSEAAFQILDSNTATREEQGEETIQRSIEGRLNQIYGSRRYVMNIVRELHLYDHMLGVGPDGRPFTSEAKIVQEFQSSMDSRVERNIVHLGYVYKDPLRAQQVVQALIRLFVNERKMAAEEQARDMLQLVDGQLRELDGVLQQRQDALDRFTLANQRDVERIRANRGLGAMIPGQVAVAAAAAHTSDPSVSAGTRRLRGRVSQLESELSALRNPGSASAPSSDDTPEVSAMRERVRAKRDQLAALRARGMMPDHPTRASAERELSELESELNTAVARVRGAQRDRENLSESERAARIERAARELQTAREELSSSERADAVARAGGGAQAPNAPRTAPVPAAPARPPGALANIVEVEAQYDRLTNEIQGTRNAYNDLLRRKLERQSDLRRIQLAGGETVRIIDPPSRPVEPEPPGRTKLAAIVIFLAMLFGLGTALVSGFIDSRVYDLTDLRRWGELPELPFIPELHLDAPAHPSSAPPRAGP
jgi:uncharacterized protein involved in exopolysaccharide biosynthesis